MAIPDLPPASAAADPAPPTTAAVFQHPDLPPRWPAVVRADLRRRHDALVGDVASLPADRVLDLSLPACRHVLAEVLGDNARSPRAAEPGAPESFDAVVSVAGLTRFADLGAALAAAVARLAPDGQLLLVEPDHRPGIRGLAASSVGALLPPARGVHLARDVAATVRSVGLTITDIRRFTLPTTIWPLRNFVSIRATRIESAAAEPTT